jgi:hypothetical protein
MGIAEVRARDAEDFEVERYARRSREWARCGSQRRDTTAHETPRTIPARTSS